jgi:TusA-related sulfurtransferase
MYGASGEASVEVKTAIQSVQKNSVIRIVIRESTSSSTNDVPKVKATTSTDLLDVKERADKFYDDAKTGSHNYIRL